MHIEAWLEKDKNCFMANDNDSFKQYITNFFSGKINTTAHEGYLLAENRSLTNIGNQLKHIYSQLLNQ